MFFGEKIEKKAPR